MSRVVLNNASKLLWPVAEWWLSRGELPADYKRDEWCPDDCLSKGLAWPEADKTAESIGDLWLVLSVIELLACEHAYGRGMVYEDDERNLIVEQWVGCTWGWVRQQTERAMMNYFGRV